MLGFATSGIFLFGDRYYKQIDGCAMGSPLAPTLANLCMAKWEKDWMALPCAPRFYKRYVDDTFAIFENEKKKDEFFDAINHTHPNIKFTAEGGGKRLPFLDMDIDVSNKLIETKVFRKPSFTGLMLRFDALCPWQWKTGLIRCFLHRAYLICSSWKLFHDEVEQLTRLFIRNGYPRNYVSSIVNRFLNNKLTSQRSMKEIESKETDSPVIVLPFFGLCSVEFKKKVEKLFKKSFNVQLRIVFRTEKVSQYVCNLKSRVPRPLTAGVVYKFNCSEDQSISYIGKTKRHLYTRVKEHWTKRSAIQEHLLTCDSCCNSNPIDLFKVIDSCRHEHTLCTLEAMYIKSHKPNLNCQLAMGGASRQLNVF